MSMVHDVQGSGQEGDVRPKFGKNKCPMYKDFNNVNLLLSSDMVNCKFRICHIDMTLRSTMTFIGKFYEVPRVAEELVIAWIFSRSWKAFGP
ncbi:hypothetical protein CDAR_468791 [Caerostris darwini]|uniref:Uncharacterized protein n=1 Tax=Caerostris darwini TaxID=1538125 RepID=A0AAV4T8E9_9ARAC|nr:hypothetical protein CDAR_468791 [Caerostris darwini]